MIEEQEAKKPASFSEGNRKTIPERAFPFSLILCKNLDNWQITFMTMYNIQDLCMVSAEIRFVFAS